MLHQTAFIESALKPAISKNAICVLDTLVYFDVFDYPLSKKEIFERCSLKNNHEVELGLNELLQLNILFCINGFYLLHNNEILVTKRVTANKYASHSLRTAKKVAHIIRRFPYVRAVMLSGSISKDYMDANSDIDYFIVTAANRLWVCRLFFVLVQKVVFFNRYKYFCYNYMVDENHLAITDQSFYTAIEASTVMPVYNFDVYQQFMENNRWKQAYFPNYPLLEKSLLTDKQSIVQRITEKFFNNSFGEWLDKWLMQKIEAKWRRQHAPEMFGAKNLMLKRHTAKAHTEGHYNRIMSLYKDKQKTYEEKYNIQFEEPKNLLSTIKLNA